MTNTEPAAEEEDWHGLLSGYQRHVREGTEPCRRCKDSRAEYMRKYRKNGFAIESARKQNRAHSRAARKLIAAHREEFRRYYTAEMLLIKSETEQDHTNNKGTQPA